MEGHNPERLHQHIISLSYSKDFNIARTEWDLIHVEISEEWDQCPCGHDIKEQCYIRNRITGNETYVGNVCINRFMSIDTSTLFDGLRRIMNDPRANANDAVIEYALRNGYLFENEYDFLKRTKRIRKPSQSQLGWKEKINRRILGKVVVRKRGVRTSDNEL